MSKKLREYIKKHKADTINEAASWDAQRTDMFRTGGTEMTAPIAINDFLEKSKQHPNTKQKHQILPYPLTETAVQEFATILEKARDLSRMYKAAAKNPALTEDEKKKLLVVANRFNRIFTTFMEISHDMDELGITG